MNSSGLRIVVTGLIAQHPMLGGVAWDYLQYPLGLGLLGHDVYYVEDSGEWPYNLDGGRTGSDWVATDCSANITHLRSVMTRIGMQDRWAYRCPLDGRWYGLADSTRNELLRTADLLINVSGTLVHPEAYRSIPRLVYIDSDPVFTQVRIASGDEAFSERVAVHDIQFSFGEAFSDNVPKTTYRWIATRQPIVLDEWQPADDYREVVTTVMSWTSYKPLQHAGVTYGQKDLEFQRFLDLPRWLPEIRFEVALGNTEHSNWSSAKGNLTHSVRALLHDNPQLSACDLLARMGWGVTGAYSSCGSLDAYRDYVRTSKAEWSVAKNGYVQGSPGWFSCRSACYLASGRPVVVQNTGFDRVLPVGEGLFSFQTLEEATSSLLEVVANYGKHSIAAREIASEYFGAEKVLGALITAACSEPERPRERHSPMRLEKEPVK
jgi:hypothetical protein